MRAQLRAARWGRVYFNVGLPACMTKGSMRGSFSVTARTRFVSINYLQSPALLVSLQLFH